MTEGGSWALGFLCVKSLVSFVNKPEIISETHILNSDQKGHLHIAKLT